jgi:hypothetical protein
VVGLGLGCLLLGPATGRADDHLSPPIREAKALADKIDQHIAARWRQHGAKPAALADDDEFLRRVYLDLMGRIPRVAEVLDFKDREIPYARENWVHKELLESSDYVNHFAVTWRNLIVPPDNSQMVAGAANNIELWLRQKFRENAHYDQIARELLAGPVGQNQVAATFFQANQQKPENLAATTSRLFLAVKLECAQCHDHPFAAWKRKQFWEFAAFFSGVQAQGADDPQRRMIKIPGTGREVQARFLDGSEPKWAAGAGTRETLAGWLIRSENPFFARAAVNRLWAHFFGLGLVEPVDDISAQNPASHPELLDELTRQFAAHDFDIKYLIRAITFSKTYQLSSAVTDPSQRADERLFACMALKGLTGEQLYDSLLVAMDAPNMPQPDQRPNMMLSPRAEFLARFSSQEKRTEHQTSILQALTLMNGKLIADATDLEKCRTLAKFANEPLDTAQRVEALFLVVLGRKPRPDESARLVKYVDGGGPKKDPKAALTDVFWALLNSAEFALNH